MARWIARELRGGEIAPDGSGATLIITTEKGKVHHLTCSASQLQWLLQALLEMSNALHDRQVSRGVAPAAIVADPALIADGFSVPVNHRDGHAILQIVGRPTANGPTVLGSVRLDGPEMLRSLAARLLDAAQELERSRHPS